MKIIRGKMLKTIIKQILPAILAIILLVFAADAQDSKICSGTGDLTETEKNQILEMHNVVRAEFKLSKLTWDCKLAKYAQEWADRDFSGHRPDNNFGENLFVSAMRNDSPLTAVHRWLSEKQFWDNGSGACQAGRVCTHYTQMIWKKTVKVGCGINRNTSGKWKTFVVCNYDPAGNEEGAAY